MSRPATRGKGRQICENWRFASNFSDNNDLLAGRKSFELSVQVIVRQEVTCFGTLRGVRKDVDSFDLLRALIGVSNVASSPDWQQSARRLVDILITGSRPIK
jgi:hypothetical protein